MIYRQMDVILTQLTVITDLFVSHKICMYTQHVQQGWPSVKRSDVTR